MQLPGKVAVSLQGGGTASVGPRRGQQPSRRRRQWRRPRSRLCGLPLTFLISSLVAFGSSSRVAYRALPSKSSTCGHHRQKVMGRAARAAGHLKFADHLTPWIHRPCGRHSAKRSRGQGGGGSAVSQQQGQPLQPSLQHFAERTPTIIHGPAFQPLSCCPIMCSLSSSPRRKPWP
jgi:hypothetical protein